MEKALIESGATYGEQYRLERPGLVLTAYRADKGWVVSLFSTDIIVLDVHLYPAREYELRQALSGEYQRERIVVAIDKRYILLNSDGTRWEGQCQPILAAKKDYISCTICAPYYPFRWYALKKMPDNEDAWQELLQWPEPFKVDVNYVVQDQHYARCAMVEVRSPMVDIYYAIGNGLIRSKNKHGVAIQLNYRGLKQKTIGRIYCNSPHGDFYYVYPAIFCMPRTLPYNFLIYKNGEFATPLCQIKYDKKYDLADVIEQLANEPVEIFTPGEIKQPEECPICFDDIGYYTCDRCFNYYSCKKCGKFSQCPLCRHQL